MTDTREALELARDAINAEIAAYSDDPDTQNNQLHRAIAAIDAALAEPEQQPVAWMMTADQYRRPAEFYREKPPFVPPVCDLVPLYAATVAPAREISDEQLAEMAGDAFAWIDMQEPDHEDRLIDTAIAFARAVLAAGGKA